MLPAFLGPFVPLPMPMRVAAPRAAPVSGLALRLAPVGGAPSSNTLHFVMQTQQENNWCWAATTSSVSNFFNSSSTWTQCAVASKCLGSTCCVAPTPCDKTFTLDGPLGWTGNLQGIPVPGNGSQTDVQTQIDGGNPVCCHISWSGGGGHFVAISGYDWNSGDVFVEDPFYGSHAVPLATFISSYRGSGTWDYTYYTQL